MTLWTLERTVSNTNLNEMFSNCRATVSSNLTFFQTRLVGDGDVRAVDHRKKQVATNCSRVRAIGQVFLEEPNLSVPIKVIGTRRTAGPVAQ